jgi:hypothetical protein
MRIASRLRPPRGWAVWLACALLAGHVALAALSLRQQSATIDEFGHLPAGLSHWQKQTFFVYRVNPPLTKMIAAAPVLFARPTMPYDNFFEAKAKQRYEWTFGRRFMEENPDGYHELFFLGRYPMVALSVLGGWLLFLWARELHGGWAGVAAVALWSFCPNILANAQLITPDIGCTTAIIAASYVYWRWLRHPGWLGALGVGLVLGIAELTKFTLLALYPIWLLLLAAAFVPGPWRTLAARAGQFAMMLFVSIVFINAGYLFEGSFKPLGDYEFDCQTLTSDRLHTEPVGHNADGATVIRYWSVRENRFRGTWLEKLPVPLPEHMIYGLDLQQRDLESLRSPSYLRGELRFHGWWYYYLYALGVKLPLGTLALLAVATVAVFWRRYRGSLLDECCVLVPIVVILALVSSQTTFNHHLRYVLPCFPFLFLHAARLVRRALPGQAASSRGLSGERKPKNWLSALVAAAVLWNAMAAVRIHPHSMSYFNELAGGPEHGAEHLINSNIDWGQDLLFLKRWLDEHPEARPLRLAYKNFVDPRIVGIEFELPPIGPFDEPPKLRPGWYAVSATLVYGDSFAIPNGHGGLEGVPPNGLVYFRDMQPVAKAGYSIFIYHVPAPANDG